MIKKKEDLVLYFVLQMSKAVQKYTSMAVRLEQDAL